METVATFCPKIGLASLFILTAVFIPVTMREYFNLFFPGVVTRVEGKLDTPLWRLKFIRT